jgi:hypothetical protein
VSDDATIERPVWRVPRDRLVIAGLVALVGLLAIRYAVLGPKFILDDWFTLYWRSTRGLLRTSDQLRSRPGGWLVYVVEFGVIGRHPLAIYAVQVALNALAAVLLYLAARSFVHRSLAAGLAALWVVLPDHSALEHWASTMGIQVSLVLFLAGVLLLVRATDAGRPPVLAIVAMVAAGACYEATLPASLLALYVVPRLRRRPTSWRALALEALPLFAVGGWMLSQSQHETTGWFSFSIVYPAHFGWGLTPTKSLGVVLGLVAAVLLVLAVASPLLPSLRPLGTKGPRLVWAGLAVIVVGTLPFARYAIDPVALGDRANVISAIGAAAAWLGLVVMLWDRRPLALALLAVLVALCVAEHLQRDLDYARAGRDTAHILTAVGRRYPQTPSSFIVVGPRPLYHHGVVGLIGPVQQAARAYLHRPSILVAVAQTPGEFYRTPPELRLDTRTIPRS